MYWQIYYLVLWDFNDNWFWHLCGETEDKIVFCYNNLCTELRHCGDVGCCAGIWVGRRENENGWYWIELNWIGNRIRIQLNEYHRSAFIFSCIFFGFVSIPSRMMIVPFLNPTLIQPRRLLSSKSFSRKYISE